MTSENKPQPSKRKNTESTEDSRLETQALRAFRVLRLFRCLSSYLWNKRGARSFKYRRQLIHV